MVNLQQDSIDFLKYYVYRDSVDELKFIQEQKLNSLKIFINIYHSDCITIENKNDWLTVHTKLKESKIELVQMSDETVSVTNNTEDSMKSDFFFIKSQQLSHRIKASQAKPDKMVHITTVESIITKPQSKCETVVITSVVGDDDGKMKRNQRWFTREIFDCHTHFTDKHEELAHKPIMRKDVVPNKKTDLKTSFRHSDSKRISSKSASFNKSDNVLEGPVTNTNNKNKLKKIKSPKRSFKNKFGNFFNRLMSPNNNEPPININVRRPSRTNLYKQYSTEVQEMEKEKPTNIIARISKNMENDSKTFEIIKDDIAYIDEEDNEDNYVSLHDRHSVAISDSSQFNFQLSNFGRKRNDSLFMASLCNCDERRYECMSKFLELRSQKKKANIEDINNFDDTTRHFIDCELYNASSPSSCSPILTVVPKVRRGSVISKNSEIYLDRIFENLKTNNQIDCPVENIVYFMNANSYKEYRDGMSTVLDPEINLENLLLFFYATRSIIKQIDDPIFKNPKVKTIMDYSKQYLIDKYFGEINKHGDLEGFIKHCDINQNGEID